ncbi:DUF2281 domain-containing protein [Methylosarcina fibrata]|uniref:DUF2281 domain-containing protein n=1 Tax=Methylosarcina fibrata TaxID=105972 RepID=UPI00037A0ABB|nr:DUF2281 domain-containing protein [Methylosarcina fibrata]
MTLAEIIYQRSLTLPVEKAQEVLDFIEFLQQRQTRQPEAASETEHQQALAYLDSIRIEWHGKPISDRDALYDDARG